MSLTKQKVIDQITVLENGFIMYRESISILEDGVELSSTYHRSTLYPGQDLTGVPDRVTAICNTVWTPEVIAVWQTPPTEGIETNPVNPTPVQS
jgi:hypothetical protein